MTKPPNLAEKELLLSHYGLIKKKLLPLINNNDVAHLDIPCHLNIGDLLIDAGTTQFIKESSARCVGRFSLLESRRLKEKKFSTNTVLLLHGGGNFGDLYPIHQQFRHDIIKQYPDNSIIILPQSVHYDDHKKFFDDSKILNQHKHLLICSRDQKSFEFLSTAISADKICLLPDMALALTDTIVIEKNAGNNVLFFRRRDKEIPLLNNEDSAVKNGFDWEDIVTSKDEQHFKKYRRALKKSNYWLYHRYGHYINQQLRDQLIQKAINHFQQFGIVDSNRLHGLILAQLLHIPQIVRDNSYGKSSNYFSTWTK